MTKTARIRPKGILQSNPLCNTFTAIAERIWSDLGRARRLGINRGEETITDNLLLDVQTSHPIDVTTIQFTKPQESISGADWEWWLTDGRKWTGMLIQAKVLKAKGNLYSAIKHKVRGQAQIDILLNQSSLKGIPALYFFYNHTRLSFPKLSWNCSSTSPQIRQLGCTVAHAAGVKTLVKQGGAGIVKLGPICVPLRCLVCCRGHAALSDDESLPNRAKGVIRFLAERVDPDNGRIEMPQLRSDPPNYVTELISAPVDDRARIMERVRAEVGPIGSLVVMRDPS